MPVYIAVRWGNLVVNLPVFAFIIGGSLLSLRRVHGPYILLGMAGSVAVAWLWWSLSVPRWRIWALSAGCDPDELQVQGEQAGLLWPKGHFFEKTELPPPRSGNS